MIVIDIGNTNTVIAIYINNKIIKKLRFETLDKKSFKFNIENYFKINKKYFSDFNINSCFLSSVVPKFNTLLKKLSHKYNLKFFNLSVKNIPFNLKIKYDVSKIGADRIANTIAVINYRYKNCIIVDFGTATTFDVIKNNSYEGGLIFPGINISHDSLINKAALLTKIKITKVKKVVSNNTKDSIKSGFYWGYLALINGIIERIIEEKKFNPKIVLTGGLSKTFKSQIIINPIINENLTLEGLGIIGKKINAK